ncbi:hypothetical protein M378DRAFT_180417 [Amanita muscaria Koide BX008]|uniref:Uncharacterized protein n=1 Tax=Amanita muscaria (strain Koide BX008) TaxID=946122 RepID=A0A0C2T266_AMAMK|nr:hypothetical protein M378DRAFT_180417 [Amanita muscaria Koide BX008]
MLNSRTSDARVIALLERILDAIETLNISIQESTSMSSIIPWAQTDLDNIRTRKEFSVPIADSSSAYSTGVVSAPSSSYSSVSLAGALQSIALQDSKRYKRNIPCSHRWYCVVRGRRVGPIQGWENVEEVTDGLTEAKFQRCESEVEALEVYQRALAKPGNVRVLN